MAMRRLLSSGVDSQDRSRGMGYRGHLWEVRDALTSRLLEMRKLSVELLEEVISSVALKSLSKMVIRH